MLLLLLVITILPLKSSNSMVEIVSELSNKTRSVAGLGLMLIENDVGLMVFGIVVTILAWEVVDIWETENLVDSSSISFI